MTSKISAESNKGKKTRERILNAAKKVFARHPYNAASIRMIGKEAGIEHPLISYYFPTKADLFKEIVLQICQNFSRANSEFLDSVKGLTVMKGLSAYIDKMIDYNQQNPEYLKILALNMTQSESLESIPGYMHIPELILKTRKAFEEKVPVQADSHEVEMFTNSFNALLITYLGASSCHAQVLGMRAGSQQYRTWVKENMLYIFLPRLRKLIRPDGD